MTLTQLPALQVILPLIAAPVCLLLRSGRLAWLLSILVSTTALIIAVLLLRLVLENGTVIYSYGGWAAPWGIEYRVDIANAFVLAIVAIAVITSSPSNTMLISSITVVLTLPAMDFECHGQLHEPVRGRLSDSATSGKAKQPRA